MLSRTSKLSYYYEDPRLRMTAPGRLFVRVFTFLGRLLLIASVLVFAVSDLAWLNWLSVFLGLFLLDYVIHFREADKSLLRLPAHGEVNLARYLTPRAYYHLEHAYDRSLFLKENFYLELIHELTRTEEVRDALARLDLPPEEFEQKTEELQSLSRVGALRKPEMTREEIGVIVAHAMKWAVAEGHRFIDVADLFAALPRTGDEFINRLFVLFSAEPEDVERALVFSAAKREMKRLRRRLPKTLGGFSNALDGGRVRHRVMNRAWTSRPTPTLDSVSRDLTDLAREDGTGFMIGHKAEYDLLVETLSRPIHPNAILIGEAGIGSRVIVNHLAWSMVKDRVPSALFDRRLVELNLANLVAGASPEELQKRLAVIVEEIVLAGNIVLYIPEIHNLLKTSGTAFLSAADALMPVILNDTFPVIGDTYPRDWKADIEERSDFSGAFEPVEVREITASEAEKILTYESLILESENKVFITFGAIKSAVELAQKYFHTNKFLPASAEELLKGAVTREASLGHRLVGSEEVIRVAQEKTNVPLSAAREDEAKNLLRLEEEIHKEFIDQEEAVAAVAGALREYRSGLSRQDGPIASFLFVGPTGVGKTELSKILSRLQFGSEKNMIRFDMTEFQDKASYMRFIGAPGGDTPGMLTEAVLGKPYSLILLDEFEKAYPDILNLFLQVLDDGRLTDNLGRTVSFENTIVIATSNAHSDLINAALKKGESMSQIGDYLKAKLVDVFRPELLNRFSKIVIFKDLDLPNVAKIAELQVKRLVAQASEQGIKLSFDPGAVRQIAKLGYDPSYGARPLRRVIDEKIKAPLASKILEGKAFRGVGFRVVQDGEGFKFLSTSDFTEKIS